ARALPSAPSAGATSSPSDLSTKFPTSTSAATTTSTSCSVLRCRLDVLVVVEDTGPSFLSRVGGQMLKKYETDCARQCARVVFRPFTTAPGRAIRPGVDAPRVAARGGAPWGPWHFASGSSATGVRAGRSTPAWHGPRG